ncbi:MAG TPA: GGDEF domain-containing protein [Noviherbaspirillum sp.]|nr:GGDEF domain-containing protein [Noviherbaspirillum sp.]
MSSIQWPHLLGRKEREDALLEYRYRVLRSLAGTGAVFLVPFAVNNFMNGRHALGGVMLFAFAILCIDALAIYHKRRPPLPLELLIIPAITGTAISLQTQGFLGGLWSYPAVLLFHFALPRLKANAYSVLQLVAVSSLVWYYSGADIAIRVFVTLALTIILINIALNIIDDLQHRLIAQTVIDPLTGAFNRRHMMPCLAYAIERSRRLKAPASLLLIDIDHFKRINDELGHAAGDIALNGLVQIVNKRARKLDLLFRIGGEEFLLLLPDTREAEAAVLAEDLRVAAAGAALLPDWVMTISIGVSELQLNESQDDWLRRADQAMYTAKRAGRNRVVQWADVDIARAG